PYIRAATSLNYSHTLHDALPTFGRRSWMTPHPPADEERSGKGGARPDASMTLLREIMERPRDPAYAEVTERRTDGSRGRSWLQELVVLLLTIPLGTGRGWAARPL